MNSINVIDRVISICHNEQFKKEIFNRIFTSPQSESAYLIQCILRILIEEHSKEFLDTLPAKVLVKYLLQKHNQEIVNLLYHEFENNRKILNYLLEFTRERFITETKELDNFKSEIINGRLSAQLRLGLQHVVNYVIEQLQYKNTVVLNDRKIVLNVNFEKFAKRVEKYYYHRCFIYLVNSFDATRRETTEYTYKVLSENYPTYLDKFFDMYNDKIGL